MTTTSIVVEDTEGEVIHHKSSTHLWVALYLMRLLLGAQSAAATERMLSRQEKSTRKHMKKPMTD